MLCPLVSTENLYKIGIFSYNRFYVFLYPTSSPVIARSFSDDLSAEAHRAKVEAIQSHLESFWIAALLSVARNDEKF